MKKGLAALGIILLVCALASYFFRPAGQNPQTSAEPPLGNIKPPAAPPGQPAPAPVALKNGRDAADATNVDASGAAKMSSGATPPSTAALEAGLPHPLEYTNLPPEAVIDALRNTFHSYASKFHGNPVGINSEITSALNGNNPTHVNFINGEAGMRINEKGELVDPWGTPYFFHQLSATDMEIHSAGPDKIMWTRDDLVTH